MGTGREGRSCNASGITTWRRAATWSCECHVRSDCCLEMHRRRQRRTGETRTCWRRSGPGRRYSHALQVVRAGAGAACRIQRRGLSNFWWPLTPAAATATAAASCTLRSALTVATPSRPPVVQHSSGVCRQPFALRRVPHSLGSKTARRGPWSHTAPGPWTVGDPPTNDTTTRPDVCPPAAKACLRP
jgi:hypothetical protein